MLVDQENMGIDSRYTFYYLNKILLNILFLSVFILNEKYIRLLWTQKLNKIMQM